MCGGTIGCEPRKPPTCGLSPRVRGNRAAQGLTPPWAGSIPACAGEPAACHTSGAAVKVYPRVCGGTCYPCPTPSRSSGLSPRVRGNLMFLDKIRVDDGSIPACAGEPGAVASSGLTMTVYPRVCGGTAVFSLQDANDPGLSPRVRGNHTSVTQATARTRSIPACAGEPLRTASSWTVSAVYPRVCGGTSTGSPRREWRWGLSPRVRGNRRQYRIHPRRRRSIPACAGEPGS